MRMAGRTDELSGGEFPIHVYSTHKVLVISFTDREESVCTMINTCSDRISLLEAEQ